MWKYILKRLLAMFATLIGVTFTLFLILHLAPGDPVKQQLSKQGNISSGGENQVNAEQLKKFKESYHLDKPWFLNRRPFKDYRPRLRFYVEFLSSPESVRLTNLSALNQYVRDENPDPPEPPISTSYARQLDYLLQLDIPQLYKVLDKEPQRENLAKFLVRQAVSLSITDHSTWVIPVLVKWIRSDRDRLRKRIGRLMNIDRELRKRIVRRKKNPSEPDEETDLSSLRDKITAELRSLTDTYDTGLTTTFIPDADHAEKLARRARFTWTFWWTRNKESFEDVSLAPYDREDLNTALDEAAGKPVPEQTSVLSSKLKRIHVPALIEELQASKTTERIQLITRALQTALGRSDDAPPFPSRVTPDASPSDLLTVIDVWTRWWFQAGGAALKRKLDTQISLLKICAKRPFPFTLKTWSNASNDADLTREEHTLRSRNVRYVWSLWWKENKSDYEPVPETRRSELDQLLNEITEAKPKKRKDIIRFQMSRSDIPYVMEVFLGTDDPDRRAICSQIMNYRLGGIQPVRYAPGPDPSPAELDRILRTWDRWWNQNRSRFRYSSLAKIGHMFTSTQYAYYLWNISRLNFGETMSKPYMPVLTRIKNAAWKTGPLALMAGLFIYLVSIPLGIVCAVFQGSLTDRTISFSLFLLYSIPGYAVALLVLAYIANPEPGYLQLFPFRTLPDFRTVLAHSPLDGAFYQNLANYMYHAFLPMFCMTVFALATLSMYSRTSMLEVIREDYIRTARAKGLSEFTVIFKHVVRNGLNPLITLFANLFPRIIGGSVIIEMIFSINGVGKLSLDAALERDYNLLMGILLLSAVLVMIGILISDLLYVVADPRISFDDGER